MSWISLDRIRVVSVVCGCISSFVALATFVVMYTVPAFTPVGIVVAGLISALALSLPVWAVGVLYSLYEGSLDVPRQYQQVLVATAVGTVGLFVVGFVAVLSQTEPFRTIGDGMYGVATVLLFGLSSTILLVGRRRHSAFV